MRKLSLMCVNSNQQQCITLIRHVPNYKFLQFIYLNNSHYTETLAYEIEINIGHSPNGINLSVLTLDDDVKILYKDYFNNQEEHFDSSNFHLKANRVTINHGSDFDIDRTLLFLQKFCLGVHEVKITGISHERVSYEKPLPNSIINAIKSLRNLNILTGSFTELQLNDILTNCSIRDLTVLSVFNSFSWIGRDSEEFVTGIVYITNKNLPNDREHLCCVLNLNHSMVFAMYHLFYDSSDMLVKYCLNLVCGLGIYELNS